MLIIYDVEGRVISFINGDNGVEPREPVGIPFIWGNIPKGKRIKMTNGIGVDVSVTPHQVILEDIPPTETEILNDKLDNAILELTTLISMGGM